MTCLACGASDDRTRLGSPWCLDHFLLSLADRYDLFVARCLESQAVEGYERKAA